MFRKFYEKANYEIILSKIKQEHILYEILEQIKIFIKIIENKDLNRNYKVILKGYIVFSRTLLYSRLSFKKFNIITKWK